ncbi:MAG: O-methyltransferase [Bdellovibrionales bacterium]|nr:O-methyltransferase [Bdellovibrionales bacterium]
MRSIQDSAKVNYIETLVSEKFEDKTSKNILAALSLDNLLGINIGLLEVQILNFLIRSNNIKKIVEVGSLYGYSAYHMAKSLPEDGKVWSVEKNQKNYKKAKDLISKSSQASKIQLVEGDAQIKLEELRDFAPFDLIFIDANKGAYGDYLNWAKDCLRPGGLVVGDNTFLFGAVYEESEQSHKMSSKNIQVMKDFNQSLIHSRSFETMILPTPEGLTVGIKK